jgi:hypothetical protein
MRLRPAAHSSWLVAVLTVAVVGALLNPFCCAFMPRFAAEAAQAETAFDGLDKLCAGKPKSVRAEAEVFSAPLLAVVEELFSIRVAPSAPLRQASGDRRGDAVAIPRHKLLQVYLV